MKQFRGVGLVLILLVVALVALPALAAIDKPPVGKGSAEVGAMVSWQSQTQKGDWTGAESTTNQTTIVQLNLGYFLTNALQLGVSTMWFGTKPEDVDMTSTFVYDLKVGYNFQLQNAPTILPWVALKVGGEAIQTPGMDTMSGVSYGGEAGVRYFLSRQASVNAQLDYDAGTLTVNSDNINTNTTSVLLGLSVFFGGAK